MKSTILLIFQCLNVHLIVTLTYNFLANHLDKSCLKWNESALPLQGGIEGGNSTCVYSVALVRGGEETGVGE